MKELSIEENIQAARKAAKELPNHLSIEELDQLEPRLCIINLSLPKVMWYSLESFANTAETTLNFVIEELCNHLLIGMDNAVRQQAINTVHGGK